MTKRKPNDSRDAKQSIPPYKVLLSVESWSSENSVQETRAKLSERFNALDACVMLPDDYESLLVLLYSLYDALGHDKGKYAAKIGMLNVLASELVNLRESSPERVEELVKALRERLLQLVQEAKDK